MDAQRDFATIQDFLVGRLSDNARRAFEDRLVRDPELVRELEQSLRIRAGLQQLRTQGYFDKAASRSRSYLFWVPALAAAALAGVALFLPLSRVTGSTPILIASLESGMGTRTDVSRSVVAQFTFVSVRGDSAPKLDLPSVGLIEIRAAPGTDQTVHRYSVTLVRQDEGGFAHPVATLSSLAMGTDGYVHCYADAALLAAGSYVLRLQPDNDAPGIAEAFPFKLRAGVTGSPR